MSAGAAVSPARVTVVIVSWNCWHHLMPCLRSLRASSFRDLEIVVIDNGSVDGTIERLEKSFPEVRLIRNADNVGHTRAVNQGFRAARGELAMVLDADTEIDPAALSEMVGFLDANPDVGLVAPRAFNSDGTVQESARNFPSPINGLFGRQSALTRLFPDNPFTRRYLKRECVHATQPFQVESVAASCMLLRKSLIDRLGEWDEGYFAYFVDTDWCYRLKKAGERVFCVPGARLVHHEQNRPTNKRSARRIWLFHEGALRFYRKNRTFGWLDPRTLVAAAALLTRAGVLIALNALRGSAPAAPAAAPEVAGPKMPTLPEKR